MQQIEKDTKNILSREKEQYTAEDML